MNPQEVFSEAAKEYVARVARHRADRAEDAKRKRSYRRPHKPARIVLTNGVALLGTLTRVVLLHKDDGFYSETKGMWFWSDVSEVGLVVTNGGPFRLMRQAIADALSKEPEDDQPGQHI